MRHSSGTADDTDAAVQWVARLAEGIGRTQYWLGVCVGTSVSAFTVLLQVVARHGVTAVHGADGSLLDSLGALAGFFGLVTAWSWWRHRRVERAVARFLERDR